MKYCVGGRQGYPTMKKADEVKVEYRDMDRIRDFIEKLPDKVIILEIDTFTPEDLPTLEFFNKNLNNFVLCIKDLTCAKVFKDLGFKFYWHYPITTYYDLQGVLALEPEYILLGEPLCFDLERISVYNVKIRLVANVAHDNYIPRIYGIRGKWIRPEDVPVYDEYVDVLEFRMCNLEQERTLLHVYKDNKKWLGNLNLLIKNLDFNVDNRAIPEEIGKIRANCQQRCMRHGACRFCETAFKFADALRKEHERRKIEAEQSGAESQT